MGDFEVHDDVLNVRMKWMLLTFETRRGVLPPLIIVVRDGISDGQYSQVCAFKIENIRPI